MAYYKRIRELREDSDKTQKEVADYLGTPYQYYAVYEKGGSEIPFERAIALSDYYNVSLDYIAERSNSKGGLSHGEFNAKQRSLLNEFSNLCDDDKKKLSKILKKILKLIE